MIAGLYHNLQRLQARMAAGAHAGACVDPKDAHVEAVAREKVREERDAVAQAILEDEHYLVELRRVISAMQLSEHGSANRQLVIRHLEDAESRILRELGDVPAGTMKNYFQKQTEES
jgi:hypothetical protein